MDKLSRIVITGAAGLVGQNLATFLVESGHTDIIAIDKHTNNLRLLQQRHPSIHCINADLAEPGEWSNAFAGAEILFLLQAQITADNPAPFERNTIQSTINVLDAAKAWHIPYTVGISSSVVVSRADDNYTRSKKQQECLIQDSGLRHCVVRPTLMFGWFDPKHFGWLSRFMKKTPVFPIPGSGRYIRQPLYVLDFCRVLLWCAKHRPDGKVYDIVSDEKITYIDIIRTIKQAKGLHTIILRLPVWMFRLMLKAYGAFVKNPPFVVDQLDALMAGDMFKGEDLRKTFDIEPTPFSVAIKETFCHPLFSNIVLERSNL